MRAGPAVLLRTSVDTRRFLPDSCARIHGKCVIGLQFWACFGRFGRVSARFRSVSARFGSVLSDILRLGRHRARIGEDVRRTAAMPAVARTSQGVWGSPLADFGRPWRTQGRSPMVRHGSAKQRYPTLLPLPAVAVIRRLWPGEARTG